MSGDIDIRSNGANPNTLFRNGKKFIDSEGNVSEDFESGAVIVRSSSKQNRASPASNDPTFYQNGNVPKDGETNIEAGCEILCLKFLCGIGGNVSSSRGKTIYTSVKFSQGGSEKFYIFNNQFMITFNKYFRWNRIDSIINIGIYSDASCRDQYWNNLNQC